MKGTDIWDTISVIIVCVIIAVTLIAKWYWIMTGGMRQYGV